MKKQLLGFAACALILSSCSQNQEIENYEQMNREEVRLAPYVNKTKASVNYLKDVETSGFKVFAVQHAAEIVTDYSSLPVFMNNIKESWGQVGAPNAWSHEGKYYWPEKEALSFFMVAPFSTELSIVQPKTTAADKAMTLPVTIKDNVAEQIDILAASVLNQTRSGQTAETVDFQFKHILSRIGFAAKVKEEENLKFKITGISFTYGANIVKDGTFTFGETENTGAIKIGSALHGVTTSSIIGLKTPGGTIVASNKFVPINADDSYLMLMPQEIPSANDKNLMMMTLRYDVAVAGDNYSEKDKIATIAIPAMKYEQGKAYTYNLILSSKSGDGEDDFLEVKFGDVTVDEWVSKENPEIEQDVNVPTPPAGNE